MILADGWCLAPAVSDDHWHGRLLGLAIDHRELAAFDEHSGSIAHNAVRPRRRAALFTTLLGFAVSLTIELLQSLLSTRNAGTTHEKSQ